MVKIGSEEKVFSVAKIATIVNSFAAEGISPVDLLKGVHLSANALALPETRVSQDQIIECCRNAASLTRDPFGAYHTGMHFHVSAYGMYGFALLCSTDFRQTMRFAVKYHQLAAPLTEISYSEEDNRAIWTIVPIPHPKIDAQLYRFLVELQFGIHVSLKRDVVGPAFKPQEFEVTYEPLRDASRYREAFGCEVRFIRPKNRMIWDAAWMDRRPEVGNETTYAEVTILCDEMLEKLQLHGGVAGQVREALFFNLMHESSLDAIAKYVHVTARTLRRKLHEEGTSFRRLVDELRMQVAIKYLRDTELTIEEIAYFLGFGDAASFRRAFRRWAYCGPHAFRDFSRKSTAARKPARHG